ncbi:U-box domain-containing protein 43-like isoform X2 [Syzygium oleosum]|nr:U-box domain-containing protein 43-like isoform X2 [Syzygium oleosum]
MVEFIVEVVVASNDVVVEKESFKVLSTYLERIVPVIKELSRKEISNSQSLHTAIEILNREVSNAKRLTRECSKRSKVYLLMNCRKIVKSLENSIREISRGLSLLPLASMDLSSNISEDIKILCDNMEKAELRAASAEEEILEKIESGIQDRTVDRSYANNLLVRIAEVVGVSTEKTSLRREFDEFKSEIENAQLRKDQAEAIQMEQIISLLERADAASSPKEREIKYFTKRKSLGTQPLEPLQSFYCPITRDVMVDPVETSSGHTFERSAIEKWFAEGNNMCPLTMTPLDASILRPNKTLRQSIEEWKDRNNMITIASIKKKLESDDEEEVFCCLEQLQDLCEQRDVHREWVIMEDYIPILLELLRSRGRDIREIKSRVLVILCLVARDTDHAKERIASVDNAIEVIVGSLGRREMKLAVRLLLELSKDSSIRDRLGKVQGCILLLVTMSRGDDIQAAKDAEELLDNLSFSDQNVVQMAKANYFKYLLQRLSSGPEDVKMTIATALAEMELTDHNKASLYEGGVLDPLLHLIEHVDIRVKEVAIKALYTLSTLPKNGLQMIVDGAVGPLLDVLFNHSSSSSSLRETLAATIMQLAISTLSQEADQTQSLLLESEDIFKLFSLTIFSGPNVQECILRTFHALCQSPCGTNVRTRLRQCSVFQALVQLCELDRLNVRANAVKLLYFLVDESDEAIITEHVGERCVETLLKIIRTSNDDEEVASAVGIIAMLPEEPQFTELLQDKGAFPAILNLLQISRQNNSQKSKLVENAVRAICRFTVPTNQEMQKRAAKEGLIPLLVQLLKFGTSLTKRRASLCLAQFSCSSSQLSRAIPKRRGFLCFSAPMESGCSIHGGICSVESSFCLIEANAVEPLVGVLDEADLEACEASLDALLTLIEGQKLQSGSKVLVEANVIPPMIKFLVSSSSSLQEKSLEALERIFRLPELKLRYGPLAQMPLVDLTQRGSSRMKSLAAKILAHLNVLPDQSSYF